MHSFYGVSVVYLGMQPLLSVCSCHLLWCLSMVTALKKFLCHVPTWVSVLVFVFWVLSSMLLPLLSVVLIQGSLRVAITYQAINSSFIVLPSLGLSTRLTRQTELPGPSTGHLVIWQLLSVERTHDSLKKVIGCPVGKLHISFSMHYWPMPPTMLAFLWLILAWPSAK